MTTAVAATYELRYRKEGRTKVRGAMTRDKDRYKSLPDRPPQFAELKGSYSRVSKQAVVLNEVQLRSNFLDYRFFPEVDTAPHEPVDLPDSASDV